MSGFAENMAHDAPEQSGRPEVVLNLATASRMLPLVRQIVKDILEVQDRLHRLEPELAWLDQAKRALDWPARSRRYRIQDEVAQQNQSLETHLVELEGLGVALFDHGRVGFPTIVNNRKAFFSWQPGEDGLASWHFEDDGTRRPIPSAWYKAADIRLLGKP